MEKCNKKTKLNIKREFTAEPSGMQLAANKNLEELQVNCAACLNTVRIFTDVLLHVNGCKVQ